MVRRSSTISTSRIDHIYRDPHEHEVSFHLRYGDLTDSFSLQSIIDEVRPQEVYNLGAQSHVKVSFELAELTSEVTGLGALRMLEAIRHVGLDCRFYQASSSELYGAAVETPQTERTPFNPQSPYAVAKAYAFYITKNYREAYGMHASNGILFNHESPRRGETLVTRKIARAVARIKAGIEETLYLGNLDAYRDWGHAADYVRAM